MEAGLTSQYCPIPWGFRGARPPFHGIRVDAERKRTKLHRKKPRYQ